MSDTPGHQSPSSSTAWKKIVALIIRSESDGRMPLSEFPNMITMEGHTGFFGMIFSLAWIAMSVVVTWGPKNIWINGNYALWASAVGICVGFVVLAWICSTLSNSLRESIADLDEHNGMSLERKADLEKKVRYWVLGLSVSYIFVVCYLIWLTGGPSSPFTPFYVMIFSLTITKNKIPHPGSIVLLTFLFAIVLSCACYWYFGSFIDYSDLSAIQQSNYNSALLLLFICASIYVPFESARQLEKQKQKRGRSKPLG